MLQHTETEETNVYLAAVASPYTELPSEREENLELIGALLTEDFEDDFEEELLAGVA